VVANHRGGGETSMVVTPLDGLTMKEASHKK